MRTIVKSSTIMFLSGIMGCATAPRISDVSRDNTLSIIEKVRCEVKDALGERIIAVLVDSKDPVSLRVAAGIERGDDIGLLDPSEVDAKSAKRIEPFLKSPITFAFKFIITEVNNNSVDATFSVPFTKETVSLGISSGKKRTRETERNISISDTFIELAQSAKCPKQGFKQPKGRFSYPITGKIGMSEVIDTFIKIAKLPKSPSGDGANFETFTDRINFTTEIKGGISPSVEITPISKQFKLTKISGVFGSNRTDNHELLVTIGLYTPPPDTDDIEIKLKNNVLLTVTIPAQIKSRGVASKPKSFSISKADSARVRSLTNTVSKDRLQLDAIRRLR